MDERDRKKTGNVIKNTISAVVILVGAVFLYSGIVFGEARIVIEKAVRICLECVGIG